MKSIVFDGEPILHVFHDLEDGSWQFLGFGDADEDDAAVVALDEIVKFDESVLELADLPLGWHAWRNSVNDPWQREEYK